MRWLTLVLILLYVQPAQAAECGLREDGLKEVKEKFNERPYAVGVTADGRSTVELWLSDVGTFTLVFTQTDGISCLIVEGDSWEKVPDAEGVGL